MMLRQKGVIIVFGVAMLVVLCLPMLNCNHKKVAAYHAFISTKEYAVLPREAKIAKCADCHKKEYDNEKSGPHANAFLMLMAHKQFVNSDSYGSVLYKHRIKMHIQDCMACHSPQDLYQTILNDSIGGIDDIVNELVRPTLPKRRTDSITRYTGVDCLTCHYTGEDIILPPSIEIDKSTTTASMTLKDIVKINTTCYSCHLDVTERFDAGIAIKKTGTFNCIKCHQEYDSKNKGTHYYYWRHDSEGKINNNLISVLNDFRFKIENGKGKVTWNNTAMPHTLPIATEMIFHIDVMAADSSLLGSGALRVNRKTDFDKSMYEELGKNYLEGIAGQDVSLNNFIANVDFNVRDVSRAHLYRITLKNKAQYWFPDSLAKTVAVQQYLIQK
jgi:hypothetical protein